MKKCKCHCSLWGEKFWNDFYSPRHPGVFFILLDILAAIAFTCCYILLAIYFEAFCTIHADAFLIMLVSNLITLLTGIFMMHFLTMAPENLTVIRCFNLYLSLFAALVLGITAIIQFNYQPTNAEMKHFMLYFFKSYDRAPRIMTLLHRNKKCCGVEGLTDFLPVKKNVNVTRIPDSCCVKKERDCGDFYEKGKSIEWVKSSPLFFHPGCFQHSTFADLKKVSPEAYNNIHWIIDWAYLNPIIIVALAAVYSYYVCYKLPKEDDIPPWAEDEFKDKVKRKLHCFSKSEFNSHDFHSILQMTNAEDYDGKSDGNFERRHSRIRTSFGSLEGGGSVTTTATMDSLADVNAGTGTSGNLNAADKGFEPPIGSLVTVTSKANTLNYSIESNDTISPPKETEAEAVTKVIKSSKVVKPKPKNIPKKKSLKH